MLLEERAESERLRQIIKALQRHRFGRRAESLPEDQLLLGLEEAEQLEAAGHAQAEEAAPAEKTARSASVRSTEDRCRPTCRGLRPLWTSRAPCARAARDRCIGSV